MFVGFYFCYLIYSDDVTSDHLIAHIYWRSQIYKVMRKDLLTNVVGLIGKKKCESMSYHTFLILSSSFQKILCISKPWRSLRVAGWNEHLECRGSFLLFHNKIVSEL